MMNDEIIKQAGEKFRTPFYLYDKSGIISHANVLQRTIFNGAQMFFSMKANPAEDVVKILIEMGYGVEVASMGEMLEALNAGCEPSNIIFTGPGKEADEIECAIENGIYCINVENLREIQTIEEIAAKHNRIVDIGIRINIQSKNSGKISMSGETQFGIGLSQVEEAIQDSLNRKYVHLIGFQIYMGTQILDALEIANNVENTIHLSFELANQFNMQLEYINFGGGFGVPYFKNDKTLDMDNLKEKLNTLFEKYERLKTVKRMVFESGRYVMAESGAFVTKILYEKYVCEKKFLICDGGSNFHSSAAFLGRCIRNNFPIHSISNSSDIEKVTIVGNLCTPTDVIGQNVEINRAVVNDYIVVEKSGAYGLSFSPYGFLSHRMPNEIIYDDGEFKATDRH